MSTAQPVHAPPAIALKEWGAAIHGLLQGRQTILLRKGGIHEKAFTPPAAGGGFVLFPTVAHSHAERVRSEHHDLLRLGEADVAQADHHVVIRAGVEVTGIVEVARPDRLPELADLHIWTGESIMADRVAFRPTKALQILVVRTVALPSPVELRRLPEHDGCRSWVDVAVSWDGSGDAVVAAEVLQSDLDRVRSTVG